MCPRLLRSACWHSRAPSPCARSCVTAARVLLADRGYSSRALALHLAAAPALALDPLTAMQRAVHVRLVSF